MQRIGAFHLLLFFFFLTKPESMMNKCNIIVTSFTVINMQNGVVNLDAKRIPLVIAAIECTSQGLGIPLRFLPNDYEASIRID